MNTKVSKNCYLDHFRDCEFQVRTTFSLTNNLKSAISTNSVALNFEFMNFFHFLNAERDQIYIIQSP